MLALVDELFRHFDLQKQGRGVNLIGGAGPFVLPRLTQVRTVAGAVEDYFALLAAALRADAAVDGGAEALFLAGLTNGAAQAEPPFLHYVISRRRVTTERVIDVDFGLVPSESREGAVFGAKFLRKCVKRASKAHDIVQTRIKYGDFHRVVV